MEEYKKVTISFTKKQLEKLDEIMSKEQGYSRSSLVREAVDYYLGYLAQKGSVSYLSPIISQNIKNISAYLCEQRDSHLFRCISPCVRFVGERREVSLKTICTGFERLSQFASDSVI